MKETLVKLVEWIESASPELWRIAMKQVYVELWQTILGIVLCVGGILGGIKFVLWCNKKIQRNSYDDWEIGRALTWSGIGVVMIIIICLSISLLRFLNIEYLAIQKLMELAP